jgi:hypothetical protein
MKGNSFIIHRNRRLCHGFSATPALEITLSGTVREQFLNYGHLLGETFPGD